MSKEKLCASFSVVPQTAKVTAIAHDKVLMKVEKDLNFWVEDMNRKRVPVDGKKPSAYTRAFKRKNGRGNQAFYSKHRMVA
jgi:hypothetical protein